MKGKLVSLLTACMFLVAGSMSVPPAFAQSHEASPEPHSWMSRTMWQSQKISQEKAAETAKSELNMTDHQIQKLENLRTQYWNNSRSSRMNLRDIQNQLSALMKTGNPDPAKVGNLVIQRRAAVEALVASRESYHESAMKVLTAAQKEKLDRFQNAVNEAPVGYQLAELGLVQVPPVGVLGRYGRIMERHAAAQESALRTAPAVRYEQHQSM